MDGPVVFRISPLGHIVAITIVACITPIALAAPVLSALYLIPLGLIAWIMRVRTTADATAVVARNVLSSRRVAWSEITALRLRPRSRVNAVLAEGTELPLPCVHVRDLPLLAQVSGGRLPNPKPISPQE